MIGSPVQPQCAVKRCSAVHGAFRPHAAAVPLYDTADRGEPDPGALEFIRVKPLKYLEEFIGVSHLKTYSVVAKEDRGFMLGGAGATNLDTSFRPVTGILHRVRDEIYEHLPEHGSIAVDRGKIANDPEHVTPGEVGFQFTPDFFLELLETHVRSGDIGAEQA